MSHTAIRVNDALTEQIAQGIRAGAYPHVAAEAFGVPKELFDAWMRRGDPKKGWEPYKTFVRSIRNAFAVARLRAENAEFENDPKVWLIHGPGRERHRQPGWSISVQPTAAGDERPNPLRDPQVQQMFKKVLAALAPFPEARLRVAQALQNEDKLTQAKEPEHGPTGV